MAWITRLARHIRYYLAISLILYDLELNTLLSLASTSQPLATAEYQQHSLISTINVLRAVIAAAAQPTAAKIADVFGRVEVILLSIVFYTVGMNREVLHGSFTIYSDHRLGTIVEACADNVETFAAGGVIFQVF